MLGSFAVVLSADCSAVRTLVWRSLVYPGVDRFLGLKLADGPES